MPDMSAQEIWDFLSAGTGTAHVATTRADGRPHVTPVWFVLDGQPGDFQLVFTTYADSVKGRGLRRDDPMAVSVDDPAPPYSFVIVEGTAQVSDDLGQVRAAAARIGGRYMGAGRAAEFGARNGVPGELLVRVTPARVIAQRGIRVITPRLPHQNGSSACFRRFPHSMSQQRVVGDLARKVTGLRSLPVTT